MADIPLGLRLNNPFNLRPGRLSWLGQTGVYQSPNGPYCEFETPFHGLRAGDKNLLAYQLFHDCNEIGQIIMRWAPASENDTTAYIRDVMSRTGWTAIQPLDLRQSYTLIKLGSAMIWHEQGQMPFTAVQLSQAADAALAIEG